MMINLLFNSATFVKIVNYAVALHFVYHGKFRKNLNVTFKNNFSSNLFSSLYCTIYQDTREGCFCSFWHSFFNSNHSGLRTKIRATYKIHGSILEDLFYTICFPCCAAIQMKQELIARDQSDFEK